MGILSEMEDRRSKFALLTSAMSIVDGPSQGHALPAGCGAIYGGAHREVLRSTQRSKGMGMIDARINQPLPPTSQASREGPRDITAAWEKRRHFM